MKFNNIRLFVTDFDTSYHFYKETLCLECTWGQPGEDYASFSAGYGSVLAIFKADLMNEAIHKKAVPDPNAQDKFAIIMQVDNVDDTYQNLKQKGVHFLTEPKDMQAWGIRVAHIRDTEDNLIEFFQDLPKAE